MILNNAANVMYGNIQVEKIYLGSEEIWSRGGGLPAEYQQVKYLESSGTQYLRTPWRYSIGSPSAPNVKIWLNGCNNGDYSIFGSRDTFNLTASDGKYIFRSYYRNSSPDINPDITTGNTIIKWFFDVTTLYADGANVGTTQKSTGVGGSLDILLFARYDPRIGYPEADDIGGNCKIASFKVQRDSTKICDMIPCYRKADNKPGMYDLVTRTFYTNEGTGEFTIGQ